MGNLSQLHFDLVFTNTRKIGEAVPLTNSEVVSEKCDIKHKNTKELIGKYIDKFNELGNRNKRGDIEPLRLKRRGKNGTKNYKTWYELNENQVNFLVTLLKNTPQVVEFKFKLVKEFSAMKDILLMQEMERRMGKEQRRILTDAIQEKYGNQGLVFAQYTNLCYQLLFGKTATEIKNEILEQELKKCTSKEEIKQVHKDINKIVRDYLTDKQLLDIKRIEGECATLIRIEMGQDDLLTTLKRLYPTPKYISL